MKKQTAKRGPKPIHGAPMVRTTIHLTEEQRRKARDLGEGDMGAGVRRVLDSIK